MSDSWICVFSEVLETTSWYPDVLSQVIQDVASFSDRWDMCVDAGEMMRTEETPSTRSKICLSAGFTVSDLTWAANNVLRRGTDLRKLNLISVM
jgi:hypothetical protein